MADIDLGESCCASEHAVIVCDPGGPVLIDLHSAAGTFVDDQRVHRTPLIPGMIIAIGSTRLIYEEVSAPTEDEASGSHRHPTLEVTPVSTAEPDAALPSVSVDAARRLLGEILDYRRLRHRALRSEPLTAVEQKELARLERRLENTEQTGGAELRRFQRYACSLPASISFERAEAKHVATIEIEDLSAGGARVRCASQPIDVGRQVWVTFDRQVAARSRPVLALCARVIWSRVDSTRTGLAFAGEGKPVDAVPGGR